MNESILTSVKKALGIAESDTSFDVDIILHINSVFIILNQLGVGPASYFSIEDSSATWDSFLTGESENLNLVKSYMYLRVRLLFDPPSSSYVLESFKRQSDEFEWRLNAEVEPVKKEDNS